METFPVGNSQVLENNFSIDKSITQDLETKNNNQENFDDIAKKYPKSRIVRCTSCNEIMRVVSGTVIFGSLWFHESCWDETLEAPVV